MQSKFCLPFLTLVGLTVQAPNAIAQLGTRPPVADSTLGTNVFLNGNNFNITGGLNRGQILFHSFNDFSVPTNSAANFIYNPTVTRDIISRVTGSSFSDIDGRINSNGANFFLINPNGITFGPNASLNVGKAFMASTANGINLVDGTGRTFTFGTNGSGDTLLKVAPDVLFASSLNMGGGSGPIINYGTLKTNNPNDYIGLIGGKVTLDGSYGRGNVNPDDTYGRGQIIAPSGRVELGGLSEFGTVILGSDVNNLRAQFPSNVARGDVSLTNRALVNVEGAGGGDIAIDGRNLDIGTQSVIRGGIGKNLGTMQSIAGDIKVNAEKITIDGIVTGIANNVGLNSTGNSGNININVGSLDLKNGAQITSLTRGIGSAGNVIINAANDVSLTGAQTSIFSSIERGGNGKGGNIVLSAPSLSLQDGAQLLTSTRAAFVPLSPQEIAQLSPAALAEATSTLPPGNGPAGNITVKASGIVNITGVNNGNSSGVFSFRGAGTGTKGNAGNITIDAGSFYLGDGARLSSSSFASGNSGDITITSKGAITIEKPSFIFSSLEAGGVGQGGSIFIRADSLSIQDGGQLQTSTKGAYDSALAGNGSAGNVTVKVAGAVDIAGNKDGYSSEIISSMNGTGEKAGNITIDAGSFSLRNGAGLESVTTGQGNAGTIIVNANDSITISHKTNQFTSGLFVTSVSPTGKAGDIFLTSPKITLDRGILESASLSGNGGNIQIGGKLPSEFASIQGSQINPSKTELLLLRNGAQITTNASGTPQQGGNGGNININSDLIVAIPNENSDISANAVKGAGGNVNINSQGLFGIGFRTQSTNDSDITASSDFGQTGNVNITTPGTDPGKDSTQLPNVPNDASNQISQACSNNTRDNKLTVTGRGGLPPNANDTLNVDVVWQDARAAQRQPTPSSATTTNPFKLAPPAVGWVFDGKGKVTLIAASTQGQPTGTSVACPNQK